MKKGKIDKALSLRTTLILITFFSIGFIGAGFYYAQNYLRSIALEAKEQVLSSNIGSLSPEETNRLQQTISSKKSQIDKLDNFFSKKESYKDDTIRDLIKYAQDSSLTIKDSSETGSVGGLFSGQNSIPGITTKYIKITLNDSIKINDLIKFIKLTEKSLPKMQLSGISIKSDPSAKDKVNVDPLIFEVYVK